VFILVLDVVATHTSSGQVSQYKKMFLVQKSVTNFVILSHIQVLFFKFLKETLMLNFMRHPEVRIFTGQFVYGMEDCRDRM
jgi:hypothetical protein